MAPPPSPPQQPMGHKNVSLELSSLNSSVTGTSWRAEPDSSPRYITGSNLRKRVNISGETHQAHEAPGISLQSTNLSINESHGHGASSNVNNLDLNGEYLSGASGYSSNTHNHTQQNHAQAPSYSHLGSSGGYSATFGTSATANNNVVASRYGVSPTSKPTTDNIPQLGSQRPQIRDDAITQLPLIASTREDQQFDKTNADMKLKEYQEKLMNLREKNRGSRTARRTSWAFTILILIILAVLVIVIIYLFTQGDSTETSLSVREICNSDTLEECMQGIIDQLRDDSTAALRSPIHYLFTFGALTLTLLLYLCLYKRRRLMHQRLLAYLPNRSIDLWTGQGREERRPYSTTPFNTEIHGCIINYLMRANLARDIQLIIAENEVIQGNTPSQDRNWGYVDSSTIGRKNGAKLSRVNFKRYTSRSYEFVSELAARQNPAYKIHSWETVREYMGRLKVLCKPPDRSTAISESRCDEFVALYEEARFSAATFDVAKWDLVRKNLHYFHQYFAPLT
mmetsp:Transcript_8791/g.17390  ORF Transcript_8791/g.17390 Transcript_8791/m.17390 type:complete len:510 (-) Transcript_8791:101-1630(-)